MRDFFVFLCQTSLEYPENALSVPVSAIDRKEAMGKTPCGKCRYR